ncbi:MAG: hypothetical protein P8Z70_13350 [Desulfuromonadales bacterium]
MLEAYRLQGRDIRGVRSFSSLVPEVYYFDELQQRRLLDFLRLRLEQDLRSEGSPEPRRGELDAREAELRRMAEEEIRRRMEAIRQHVERGGGSFESLEEVFRHRPPEGRRVEERH